MVPGCLGCSGGEDVRECRSLCVNGPCSWVCQIVSLYGLPVRWSKRLSRRFAARFSMLPQSRPSGGLDLPQQPPTHLRSTASDLPAAGLQRDRVGYQLFR